MSRILALGAGLTLILGLSALPLTAQDQPGKKAAQDKIEKKPAPKKPAVAKKPAVNEESAPLADSTTPVAKKANPLTAIPTLTASERDAILARKILPPNFGKLELSEQERAKVISLYNNYRLKRAPIQKMLDQLKEEFDKEAEAMLNASQRSKLKEIRSASKKAEPVEEEK